MMQTVTTLAPPRTAAERAWGLLFQFVMSLDVYWDELSEELGLPTSQAHALIVLTDAPVPMSHLAGLMHCDASNVTGLVDRLEQRGLVERRPTPSDRRVKLVALTSKGRRLRDQALVLVARPHPTIAALSAADQKTLHEILRRALS